ncbi:glutamate mutase L [Enterococcus sp. DIV0187]|uniref:glutamate mutase L n=1 Tax=Enterococcus sp. DIV0187 TaxID=2774644 RepID=UPI003F6841A8
MYDYAVLVDFGSTYTKVVCVNLKERKVVVTDKFPSTVHSDAAIGLNQCFEVAIRTIGKEKFGSALKLATSSAAGGLRMAVVGLTNSISIEAGRNASFSAGAKIVCNTAGILSKSDILKIEESRAEILLLCGGHEGGNTYSLLKNAEILSESNLTIPIIYAGNSHIEQEIRRIFMITGKECFLAENIIPAVGSLNTEPTTEIIRELFMKRITNMKGVGFVQKEMNEMIVPTPAAVLAAGELLSLGTKNQKGLGPLMMADIGGATTDIYSYLDNKSFSGAKRIGSPEPFAKRTVEGDLGMRESSICLVNELGTENFAKKCGISESKLNKAIEKRITTTEYIALGSGQKHIDYCIACGAISLSARRHAGTVSKEFNDGCRLIQRGKNLTEIKTVIGTGGIIVNESNAFDILKKVEIESSEVDQVLLPEKIDAFIDQDYVLFAAGLLCKYDEEAALTIMKKSLNLT